MKKAMPEKHNILRGRALASRLNSPKSQKRCSFPFFTAKNLFAMNFIKAFSIAEVAIALVIGSIILGMSAPMVTKQIKNQSLTDTQLQVLQTQINQLRATKTNIPSGAIMFFEGSCPDDSWQDLSSRYAGRYVRIDGSYDICDKQGENTDGTCKSKVSTVKLNAGTIQGEANRRIQGTFPGQDADVSQHTTGWTYKANNYRDGYVEKMHDFGFLSGAFDYVKTSELPGQTDDAGYDIPSNWKSFVWWYGKTAKMYNVGNQYVYFIDPNVLSLLSVDTTVSGHFFLNSIDTKRVLPTDTVNDETRPKTIVLKACKAP